MALTGKYYFVLYEDKHYDAATTNTYTYNRTAFVDTHPVVWFKEMISQQKPTNRYGNQSFSDYTLLSWQEIPKEIYLDQFKEVGGCACDGGCCRYDPETDQWIFN